MANEKKESNEIKRALDYQIGDVVQIKADGKEYSGKIGIINTIRIYEAKNKQHIVYNVKFSDTEAFTIPFFRLRLLRPAEGGNDDQMVNSKFWPR